MAYNETQAARFPQGIARLHDVKGNPAPQITPEISHGVTVDQVSTAWELEPLFGRRNCFAGITAPAIAAVSAGVMLQAGPNMCFVVTGVQVQKAVAGQVSIQIENFTFAGGTFSASFAFYRDTRFGPFVSARTMTKPFTHLTGGLPASPVVKRVNVPANTLVQIPITPGLVIVPISGSPTPVFGVFNETLNEAMDVMIDFYERPLSPSELILPQ